MRLVWKIALTILHITFYIFAIPVHFFNFQLLSKNWQMPKKAKRGHLLHANWNWNWQAEKLALPQSFLRTVWLKWTFVFTHRLQLKLKKNAVNQSYRRDSNRYGTGSRWNRSSSLPWKKNKPIKGFRVTNVTYRHACGRLGADNMRQLERMRLGWT